MPICVLLVVIAEIMFLGRVTVAHKKSLVNSWVDSFYQFTTLPWSLMSYGFDDDDDRVGSGQVGGIEEYSVPDECEEWLEKHDFVAYSRDFEKEPVYVSGSNEVRPITRFCQFLVVHCLFLCFFFSLV